MRRALPLLLLATGCLSKPGFSGGGDDTPVAVIDPLLAIGDNHACAIDSAQQLWCWGDNDDGQLGTNDPTPVATPVRVGAETGWTAVSAGRIHTCGLLAGQVRCWGSGIVNQTAGAHHPEDPIDLGGFVPTQLFAHEYGTCVLDAAGAMRCWGQPSLASTDIAVVDPGGRGLAFAQVAFDQDHACAVATDGTVYCWGSNQYGQLGVDGPDVVDPSAARPRAGSYRAVSIQGSTTCAVTAASALECWGSVDTSLFAGKQPMTETSTGTIIDSDHPWGALSLSQSYGCGDAGGSIYCWGYSDAGQLGDGYDFHGIKSAPVLTGATGVVTGDGFTCARDTSGKVSCWGHNRYGNLGTGEVARVQAPVVAPITPPLENADTFSFIAAGARHMCAITKTGLVYCWGDNGFGQVDPASTAAPIYTTPHLVPMTSKVRISAGTDHTCAIELANNDVECWGSNAYQQLGATTNAFTTAMVHGPFDWISAGASASCGVVAGVVDCWGFVPGQDLHVGGDAPIAIAQVSNKPWTQVEVGDEHVIATNDAEVWAWGERCAAIGATGGLIAPSAPMPVAGLAAGSYDLAAGIHGGAGSCAITSTALSCWGANKATQLQSTDPAACVPASVTPPTGRSARRAQPELPRRPAVARRESWLHADVEPDAPVLGRQRRAPDRAAARQHVTGHDPPGVRAGSLVPDRRRARGWLRDRQRSDDHQVLGTSVHGELGNGTRFQDRPVAALFTP